MTLKIVLVGILTLVPKYNWDQPEAIFVLLNSGGNGMAAGGLAAHQPILFFEADNLAEGSRPPSSFILSSRDCSVEDSVAFQPLREAWIFEGIELSIDKGRSIADPDSPNEHSKALEALLCPGFEDRSSDPLAPCDPKAPKGPWKVRHDVRWLLDMNALYDCPLPLDLGCLKTPVGESCAQHLAARVVLDSGLLSTRTLSGERSDGWLKWTMAPHDSLLHEGNDGVTFAGSMILEIEYPEAKQVTIFRRQLNNPNSPAVPALSLKPREGENTVVVFIENVPLSERLPTTNDPCERDVISDLHHAELIYNLVAPGARPSSLMIPRAPREVSAVGVGENNPPKCEPPNGFTYPKD